MTDAAATIHEEAVLRPPRGRILPNGIDIRDPGLAEVRSVTGYVQLEIFLFAGDRCEHSPGESFGRCRRSVQQRAKVGLSTIASADEILVLHHGEVVERGVHGALVRKGGVYKKLWRLQLGEGAAVTPTAGNRLPPVGAVR